MHVGVISGANVAETDAVSRVKSPERKRARKIAPTAAVLE